MRAESALRPEVAASLFGDSVCALLRFIPRTCDAGVEFSSHGPDGQKSLLHQDCMTFLLVENCQLFIAEGQPPESEWLEVGHRKVPSPRAVHCESPPVSNRGDVTGPIQNGLSVCNEGWERLE